MSTEIDGSLCDDSFHEFTIKSVFRESSQNCVNVYKVFFEALGEDENVIQVGTDVMVVKVTENAVHHFHKSCWRIGESHGANKELVRSVTTSKGSFVDRIVVDTEVVEAVAEIQLGKVTRAVVAIAHFGDKGKRGFVLDGVGIQGAVIDAQTEGAVRLASEEYWSSIR